MLDLGVHIGLERLGFAPRSVGYVERDAYAAAILLERMENKALESAPVWAGNLQDVRWEHWAGAVDCLMAGFPCQPHSMAGKREGTDDSRWIWPAITECIRMVRPWLVILENVSGLRSSGGMAPVLTDLAALGYRIEWDSIRASNVGASHQRERVFIVGYARHYAGNAEQWQQQKGAASRSIESGDLGAIEVADPSQPRREGREQHSPHDGRGGASDAHRPAAELCDVPLFAPGPNDDRWTAIISEHNHLAPALKPGFCVVVDGLAVVVAESRPDQLRTVGNGVVPLQAALATVLLARRAGISG